MVHARTHTLAHSWAVDEATDHHSIGSTKLDEEYVEENY